MDSIHESFTADDIPWQAWPVERAEDLNLLVLEDEHLLTYVAELRAELRTVRRFLSAALTIVHRQHAQGQRMRANDGGRTRRPQVRALDAETVVVTLTV